MWLNLHDDGRLTSDTDSVPDACELYGISECGRYALVLSPHAGPEAYIFGVRQMSDGRRQLTSPRWECTVKHLEAYDEVYRARFPMVLEPANR